VSEDNEDMDAKKCEEAHASPNVRVSSRSPDSSTARGSHGVDRTRQFLGTERSAMVCGEAPAGTTTVDIAAGTWFAALHVFHKDARSGQKRQLSTRLKMLG
jgi:hypothetical protein